MTALDLTARLQASLRTGDPYALWPQLAPSALAAAHGRITEVTRAVLRGKPDRPVLETPASDARALGVGAFLSGVGPLLGLWVEQGRLPAGELAARVLAEHLDQGRRRAAKLSDRLGDLLDALIERRVTPTLLKGSDTAYRYFPEPGTRPRADTDLLVAPHELTAAHAALQAAGYVEYRRTRYANRSEWRHADATQTLHSLEVDHADNPWSVDLHVALERWYFRGLRAGFGVPTDDQLAPWVFDGRPVHVLAQPLLTAFLALHASYGISDFRPLRAVELVLVVRRDVGSGALRWDALAELLDRTATARFVYPALELTERWIPGTVEPDIRQQLQRAANPRIRRVVDQVEAHGLRLAYRSLDENFMWAQSPSEWLGNLSSLLWSGDDMMTVGDHWRLYLRRARMLFAGHVRFRATDAKQP